MNPRDVSKPSWSLTAVLALSFLPTFETLQAGETLPPIVFVSRDLSQVPNSIHFADRQHAVVRATSAALIVRDADGSLRTLLESRSESAPASAVLDIADPDVSFDGTRIVFAALVEAEDNWRLFDMRSDGSDLRQVTASDGEVDLAPYGDAAAQLSGSDDLDPCWLPDGRICFVSTRHRAIAPDRRYRTTNLFVVDPETGEPHRITTERFGADTPAVDPLTGRIVYSRWWRSSPTMIGDRQRDLLRPGMPEYADLPRPSSFSSATDSPIRRAGQGDFFGINNWFLGTVRPDGGALAMFAGLPRNRRLTNAYRPSFLPDGSVVALFLPRTPFIGVPRGYGLRHIQQGVGSPAILGGMQTFSSAAGTRRAPEYASASALPDGRLLVSFTRTRRSYDYGLFVQENAPDSSEAAELLLDLPETAELDAVPLIARPLPRVVLDEVTQRASDLASSSVEEAFVEGGRFTFLCENIYSNAPVDAGHVTSFPVGVEARMQFFMAPRSTTLEATEDALLITEIALPPDGRIEVELPADVPLFEVLRLPLGDALPVSRDSQLFHVGAHNFGRPGATIRCVGCHVGHSLREVPEDPEFTNLAPSAHIVTTASSSSESTRASALIGRTSAGSWIAASGETESRIDLRWSTRLSAREIVLWGHVAEEGGQPRVQEISITTSLDGEERQRHELTRALDPRGTRLPLDETSEFDALRIDLRIADAASESDVPTLAEVEVIARATGAPRPSWLRGDTDCNLVVDLSDALGILLPLFISSNLSFCCHAAADADGSHRVDLSDAVLILRRLFLDGVALPAPFPQCGPAPRSTLPCALDLCG